MSLLRRLEGQSPARPAAEPAAPAPSGDQKPPERPGAPPPPPSASTAAPANRGLNKEQSKDLKTRIQERLLKEMDPKLDVNDKEKVTQVVQDLFDRILEEEGILIPKDPKAELFNAILAEIIGFGPIDILLRDPSVSEIMVNGPHRVFCEQKGKLKLCDGGEDDRKKKEAGEQGTPFYEDANGRPTVVKFEDDGHVKRVIERIVAPLGRRCDESTPLCDARLPDGSRVNAVIPPLALDGPTLTIRKFPSFKITAEMLVNWGSITPELRDFLRACVLARFNVVVSGGTGSGKTTLLNVLSSFIPSDERIITVEDAAELQLDQIHWVRLETRKPNIEGKGGISIRDLVMNTLRMRPDRVVIGECRGGEALDMIQAMNTGHDGSLTTIHSNNPKECISRLEVLIMMVGMDLPLQAIRKQIAGAVGLIVQQSRMQDGSRRVTHVTECQGMEGETVTLQDIFLFEQEGVDPETGKIIGRMKPTGLRPKNVHKFTEHGIHLEASTFGAAAY